MSKKEYTAEKLCGMFRIALSLDSYGRLEFLNMHGMNLWKKMDEIIKRGEKSDKDSQGNETTT